MKRFLLKKLIVINNKEKESRELKFTEGLNIILGENKTGKSSLIKSIFHTLGCRVKFESDWKKLIDNYVLYFQYGVNEYCLHVTDKTFSFFSISEGTYRNIIKTDDFHEFSEKFMEVLNVPLACINKSNGNEISATPPLLFRFQYIDQDLGWGKVGESFTNLQYIKDWRSNSRKYVVGFQGEDYYKTKKDRDLLNEEINKVKVKINHFNEFIEHLKESLKLIDGISDRDFADVKRLVSDDKGLSNDLLVKINNIKRDIQMYQEEISKLKNERYEKYLELNYVKEYLDDLEDDHEFALDEGEELICPFCGVHHENNLENRIEIVKDIQSGNKMINTLRSDLAEIDDTIARLESNKHNLTLNLKKHKDQLENIKENMDVLNSYRDEGKYQIIKESIQSKDALKQARDEKLGVQEGLNDDLKELNSKKRRNEITKDLKEYCYKVFNEVNLPSSYVKLKDFVQELSKTGSENPRMIYAYHIALYLFNLNRIESPFNFLVIDTPNQQGQDENNLKNIFSVLSSLNDNRGQVILGTERKTNYESNAQNVIHLQGYKKCLNNEKYDEHQELLSQLNELGIFTYNG